MIPPPPPPPPLPGEKGFAELKKSQSTESADHTPRAGLKSPEPDTAPQKASSFLLTADDISVARASLRRSKPSNTTDKPEKPPKDSTPVIDWKSQLQRRKKPAPAEVKPKPKETESSEKPGPSRTNKASLGPVVPTIAVVQSDETPEKDSGKSRDYSSQSVIPVSKDQPPADGAKQAVRVHVHVTDAQLRRSGSEETGSESSASGSLEKFTDNDINAVLEADKPTEQTQDGSGSRPKPYRSQSAVVPPVSAQRKDSRAQRLQEKAKKLIRKVSVTKTGSAGTENHPKTEEPGTKLQRNWSDRLRNLWNPAPPRPDSNPFTAGPHNNPFLDPANPDDDDVTTRTQQTNPFHVTGKGSDVTHTNGHPLGPGLESAQSFPPFVEQNPFLPGPVGNVMPHPGYPYPYVHASEFYPPFSAPVLPYPPMSATNPFFQDVHPGVNYGDPGYSGHHPPPENLRYPSNSPFVTWSAMRPATNHVTQRWRSAAAAVNIVDYLRARSRGVGVLDTGVPVSAGSGSAPGASRPQTAPSHTHAQTATYHTEYV